jgi:hypothetical protein
VEARDTFGEWGTSATYRVRARWGLTQHHKDLGSVPTTWSVSTLNTTTGATSAVVLEYNSADDAGGTGLGAWKASLAEVTRRRWLRYRVWLLAWGTSPATSPSLDKLVVSYGTQVLQPDHWTAGSSAAYVGLDEGAMVYGTQALRVSPDGTVRYREQTVPVSPNTDYMLSGFVKTSGAADARVELRSSSGLLVATPLVSATTDWTRYSVAWNSGPSTEVIVRVRAGGASGTLAWFDAIQLEASTVVTPWRPGFVGEAVVVDAGGLMVDGSAGGVLRLRGTTGGARDVVELGANGLRFGGDTDLYSDAADRLTTPDTLQALALRATSTGELTLSSTGHGFQVGPDGAANLAMDQNEVQARNAGAAAALHLNPDGGAVVVGQSVANALEVGSYPSLNSSQLGRGYLELRGSTPYVDFSNDASIDFDARLRLTGDDLLAVEGADLLATANAILGSRVGRALSKTTQSLAHNTQVKLTGWSAWWTGLGTAYNSTNASIVVARAGLYLIFLEVSVPARSDYQRVILQFAVAANDGNPTTVVPTDEWTVSPHSGGFNHARHYKAVWIRALNANDAVAFHVVQTNSSSGAVTMDSARAGLVALAL